MKGAKDRSSWRQAELGQKEEGYSEGVEEVVTPGFRDVVCGGEGARDFS